MTEIKKATKTLKYSVANLCASKCLNSTLYSASLFLKIRSWLDTTVIARNSQSLFAWMTLCKNNSEQMYCASSYKAGRYDVMAFERYIYSLQNKRHGIKSSGQIFILDISRPMDGNYAKPLHGE